MKRFILKSLVFLSPVILLSLYAFFNYSLVDGDLIRLGYISKDSSYRKQFEEEYKNPIYYHNVSTIDTTQVNSYKVLTVGDSFSDLNKVGYKNYVAKNDSVSLLHYDRRDLIDNPFEVIYALMNGDFFEKVNVEYVIFQSVERNIVQRAQGFNKERKVDVGDLLIEDEDNTKRKTLFNTNTILRFPYYEIVRSIRKDDNISDVYWLKLQKDLFTGKKSKDLLVYYEDITTISLKNDMRLIEELNTELNLISEKLKGRGIKMIMLPAPDKYDIYYEYIIEDQKKEMPLLFHYFNTLEKDYLYINSYKLLKNAVRNGEVDIYFADDTHWSPWGGKLIASEILIILNS